MKKFIYRLLIVLSIALFVGVAVCVCQTIFEVRAGGDLSGDLELHNAAKQKVSWLVPGGMWTIAILLMVYFVLGILALFETIRSWLDKEYEIRQAVAKLNKLRPEQLMNVTPTDLLDKLLAPDQLATLSLERLKQISNDVAEAIRVSTPVR